MIARPLLSSAFVLLIVMLVGLYSFTISYMACSALFGTVSREQKFLYDMCNDLADLSVPLGALAYKNLPQIGPQIATIEAAQARLQACGAAADMADACDSLCESVSNLVGAINTTPASDSGNYIELRDKLGSTLHQIVIAKIAYANAVTNYNALLAKPVATAWSRVTGFLPAEPFVCRRKPVETQFPDFTPDQDSPSPKRTSTPKPAVKPATKPAKQPLVKPATKPAKHAVKPAMKPVAKPAPKPATKPAQQIAPKPATATNDVLVIDPFRT